MKRTMMLAAGLAVLFAAISASAYTTENICWKFLKGTTWYTETEIYYNQSCGSYCGQYRVCVDATPEDVDGTQMRISTDKSDGYYSLDWWYWHPVTPGWSDAGLSDACYVDGDDLICWASYENNNADWEYDPGENVFKFKYQYSMRGIEMERQFYQVICPE